jgi:peptide/nickel transport system permease protein
MMSFLLKLTNRLFYTISLFSTIYICTFLLFFAVYSPDDIARQQLGDKHVTQEMIDTWKEQQGYNNALFWDKKSIFVQQTSKIIKGEWGLSFQGTDIRYEMSERMKVSVRLMFPIFFLSIWGALITAVFLLQQSFSFSQKYNDNHHNHYLLVKKSLKNLILLVMFVILSTTSLTWLLVGQWLGTVSFPLFPVSGYDFNNPTRFLILPILLGCVIRIPPQAKLYLNLMQQEQHKDYVRTAVSKKLPLKTIIWRHILPNVLPSFMTLWANSVPFLLLGSLLLEKIFALPGLGDYILEAVHSQDLQVLQIMVLLSVFLTLVGQFLGDVLSDWVNKSDKVYG